MHTLLKELAEQAGYPDYMTYGQDKVLERFAELIVRECIKVIETNHPEFDCKESADNLIRRAGRMDAMDEIKQHFEVEL